MARLLGLDARIYVPELVSATSQAAIRSEGADITIVHGDYDYAVRSCAADAAYDANRNLVIRDTAWEGYKEVPNVGFRRLNVHRALIQNIDTAHRSRLHHDIP